ncbi:M3 family metallopeptidase [Acidicapsa dinghuensis]|uniref:M3 family metallopeptidase n=1 Tax=Acidicapsa dinghuensis TaxID=2218256 RepID=A0ABW1ENE8_9BACT|nr:M3 family metallopeptidase [Acidicapsa dinghuensis]
MLRAVPRVAALCLCLCAAACAQVAAYGQDKVAGVAAPWSGEFSRQAVKTAVATHLEQAQQALSAVGAGDGAETIQNTLVPYDEALRHINDAVDLARLAAYSGVAGSKDDTDAELQEATTAKSALRLNPKMYAALSHLDVSAANETTQYYVQRQTQQMQLAGVERDEGLRKRLLELYEWLAKDEAAFERNAAADPRHVTVIDPADLDGLPQDFLKAHPALPDGRIFIDADETTYPVVMKYAERADFRVRFSETYYDRAYPKNRDVLQDMLETRYQIARLLNYDSWVDLRAQDSMIGSVRNIDIFLNGIDTGDRPVVDAEWAMLLDEKRKEDPDANDIYAYDFARLATLIRKDQFDLDEESIRDYFPYEAVKQRVLQSMAAVFRVELVQSKDAPVWDAAVEAWDVLEGGKPIGRIYLDMHPRAGKFTGNRMLPVAEGVKDKEIPQAALLCNFPGPHGDDPGLMEHEEVVAFVHQMAHALHFIFAGQQSWAGVSGISVQSDFAEVPALMMEDWLRNPKVLAGIGHNYKTGAALSPEQIAHINNAFTFGRAIDGAALPAAFAYISNDLHRNNPKGFDLNRMTLYDLRQYGRLMPLVAEGRMYSSMYMLMDRSSEGYARVWDKVIAEDFYQQFVRQGLLEGDAGPHFRAAVLEPGGARPASELVKEYLGRKQEMTAFESWMGAEFHEQPTRPHRAY